MFIYVCSWNFWPWRVCSFCRQRFVGFTIMAVSNWAAQTKETPSLISVPLVNVRQTFFSKKLILVLASALSGAAGSRQHAEEWPEVCLASWQHVLNTLQVTVGRWMPTLCYSQVESDSKSCHPEWLDFHRCWVWFWVSLRSMSSWGYCDFEFGICGVFVTYLQFVFNSWKQPLGFTPVSMCWQVKAIDSSLNGGVIKIPIIALSILDMVWFTVNGSVYSIYVMGFGNLFGQPRFDCSQWLGL